MNNLAPAKILLIEDSAADAEMTLRALNKRHPSSSVAWMKDGPEALDYLFFVDEVSRLGVDWTVMNTTPVIA